MVGAIAIGCVAGRCVHGYPSIPAWPAPAQLLLLLSFICTDLLAAF